MHFGPDQQAGCVGDDMPLAAVDFRFALPVERLVLANLA
jgi:hypothetical protein